MASVPFYSCRTLTDGAAVRTVVFFDIDGTLVRSSAPGSNHVHADSFSIAMKSVYGVSASIDEIPHQGMTDMWIIDELLKARGLSQADVDARMPDMLEAMVSHVRSHEHEISESLVILPGVSELLKRLAARNDVVLGLVTGNVQDIGIMKLRACGLEGVFTCGGFGSDHRNRGELIHIGLQRACDQLPALHARVAAAAGESIADRCSAAGVAVWHIGDTLHDLTAATYARVSGIGVGTGAVDVELLTAHPGRHTILRDLTDTDTIMRDILKLSGST